MHTPPTLNRALADPTKTYLFLTGAPGIGKTTALKQFLAQHVDDGFLLIYISPRKHVNRDIVKKFQEKESTRLLSDRLWTVASHSDLIKEHGPGCVVEYRANTRSEHFWQHGVYFVPAHTLEADEPHPPSRGSSHFKRATDDTVRVKDHGNCGVLKSLCQALYTMLDQGNAPCIVATASIQSLKKSKRLMVRRIHSSTSRRFSKTCVTKEAIAILNGEPAGTILGSLSQTTLCQRAAEMQLAHQALLGKLTKLLSWPHWQVRISAAKALGSIRRHIPPDAVRGLHTLRRQDPVHSVQKAADDALAEILSLETSIEDDSDE